MVTNDPVIQHNTTRVTYLIYSSSTLEARERNPSSLYTVHAEDALDKHWVVATGTHYVMLLESTRSIDFL